MPDSPAPFVIVGMMALFGGVAKAPIAVILMVAEMTNEFSMIIPAMLTVVIAYLITGVTRIYESQVDTRADSPAHRGEYAIPLVQMVTVADAMRTSYISLSPDTLVADAEKRMVTERRRGFPVLANGLLVGIFTASDAVRAEREGLDLVGEAMSRELHIALPGDSVHNALKRMTTAGVSRLPVTSSHDSKTLLGMIDARDIAMALDAQLVLPGRD